MSQPSSREDDARAPATEAAQQAVRVWAAEAAATWVVRRTLETGYHRATGRALPTARDRDIPFRRVLLWAAVTAAAVAAANVTVDRVVLRTRPPQNA